MAQIRGLFTFNGVLHAVRDSSLLSIDSGGTSTSLATIGSTGGIVDMDANLTQLCIADGSQLYVWDGVTLTTLDAADNYVGGNRISFIDQRMVFDQLSSQRFGWTALADATSIDALDFASAEAVPDNLVAAIAHFGEVWLFGESSTEVWYSVGGSAVFERAKSAFIPYGLCAAHSLQSNGASLMWLGKDKNGQAAVLQSSGYGAKRISTRAQEEKFDGLDLSNSRAFCYTDGGQQFYCLNVPGVNTTLVYDTTFGQWHERAELVDGDYQKWRPTCHAFAYGKHYFGALDGNIYVQSDSHTFAGDSICRERVFPVVAHPTDRRVFHSNMRLQCETGTGALVQVRYSDDGGNNWSNWQYASTGALGKFGAQVQLNRLGSARRRVYQVRMTDDAPFNLTAANVEIQ